MRRDLRPDVPALTDHSAADLRASRRQLVADSLGIIVGASGFGLVLGLAARAAGFSPVEVAAMSVFVFAGAAQFAAVGYVVSGFSWAGIVVLTAFLNSRHFLYSAALAPYFAHTSRPIRALAGHLLTDEAFALAIAHFRRIGRLDLLGYFWGAFGATFIPWNIATLVGVLIGGQIPDPTRFGLDVIFPAAMAGLAVGLIAGRRDVVAAIVGVGVGVAVSLAWDPAAGIIAGGLLGPVAGLLLPGPPAEEGRSTAPLPFGGASTDAKIEAGLGEDRR